MIVRLGLLKDLIYEDYGLSRIDSLLGVEGVVILKGMGFRLTFSVG